MAFISSLQTRRPNYGTLFKWVALIFLAPLIALAIGAILITILGWLPGPGQVLFGFLGGVFAAIPVIVLRKRRRAEIRSSSETTLIIVMIGTVVPLLPALGLLLKSNFEGGLIEILLAFLVGLAFFLGTFELSWQADRTLKKWQERHRHAAQRHKEIR